MRPVGRAGAATAEEPSGALAAVDRTVAAARTLPARVAARRCRPRRTAGAAEEPVAEAVRERVGIAQAALLSALVAGTPAPEGFDRARLRVQGPALARKRGPGSWRRWR